MGGARRWALWLPAGLAGRGEGDRSGNLAKSTQKYKGDGTRWRAGDLSHELGKKLSFGLI